MNNKNKTSEKILLLSKRIENLMKLVNDLTDIMQININIIKNLPNEKNINKNFEKMITKIDFIIEKGIDRPIDIRQKGDPDKVIMISKEEARDDESLKKRYKYKIIDESNPTTRYYGCDNFKDPAAMYGLSQSTIEKKMKFPEAKIKKLTYVTITRLVDIHANANTDRFKKQQAKILVEFKDKVKESEVDSETVVKNKVDNSEIEEKIKTEILKDVITSDSSN